MDPASPPQPQQTTIIRRPSPDLLATHPLLQLQSSKEKQP